MRLAPLLLALAMTPLAVWAQGFDARSAFGMTGPTPTVMVLGTHHMANNNHDAVKTNYDDPRSPKRQAEIRVLLDHLKAYHPTKIAIESPYGSTRDTERYAQYLHGAYELTANEVDQVAFRLAKELGHATVYPIDWKADMDIEGMMKFAGEHGQEPLVHGFEHAMAAIGAWQTTQQQKTILEMYRSENDPVWLRESQALYTRMLEVAKDSQYVGADVVGGWYTRNLHIATNILRTATDPNDRVLVLIGSGHAYYLDEILSRSPSVHVERVERYLK